MKFSEYLEDKYTFSEDATTILEVAMFSESMITEEIDFRSALEKIGFKAHKSGPGVIGMIMKAGKQVAKVLYQAFLTAKDPSKENKEKLKQTLKDSKIKKEQIIDFVLNLDMLTLHLISGPIHMIEALTGWHIWANIKKTAKDTIDRIKSALSELKAAAKTAMGTVRQKITGWINALDSLLKMELKASKI